MPRPLLLFVALLATAVAFPAAALAARYDVMSITRSSGPAAAVEVSLDGRYVAFCSFSDSVSTEDSNGTADVYVFDTQTSRTELISPRKR